MSINYIWKKFRIIEGVIILFFCFNIVFILVNREINILSDLIASYFFWLSIGLYIGFVICKVEMKKAWKKILEFDNERKTANN